MLRPALLIVVLLLARPAVAGTLLIATSTEFDGGGGYAPGYGNASWQGFTQQLDAAAADANVVVETTGDLSNAAQVAGAGAIWVDLRNNGTTGIFQLSASEKANLSTFLASGRRVVFIGEASAYASWNRSFLGLVNADIAASTSLAATRSPAVSHPLLSGVTAIAPNVGGVINLAGADTPTALFDPAVAALFGSQQNALAILDSDLFADGISGAAADNLQFRANTIGWIVAGAVPSPGGGIGGLLLLALASARRTRGI